MSRSPRDERVDRYLQGLPGQLPPAGLGERIIDRHLGRRRLRRWLPLAAAACLLTSVLAWQLGTPSGPGPRSALPSAALNDVRSVDRRLQAAYLAGAGEAELAPLWRARQRALAELQHSGEPSQRRQVRL